MPMAYGSSQARGPIRARAASLPHSLTTWDLSRVWDQHHSSPQHWIPPPRPGPNNPLSRARDQIRILMDTSQIHFL